MNARPPTPHARFSALLSRFSPEIVALVKRCLPRLRRVFPGAYELVYDYSHSLVVAFGTSERGYEAIVALAIYPRWVRLYFGDGKSLPDPKGLLEGSGARVRSITLEAASDLDHRDIRALIQAAIEHSGASFTRARPARMVIKSGSKKKSKAATKRRSKAVPKKRRPRQTSGL